VFQYSSFLNYQFIQSRQRSILSINRFQAQLQSPISNDRTIAEEISDIIDVYLIQARNKPLNMISPSIISENSHILAKENYFEAVIQEKLSAEHLNSRDTALLEQINSFLSGIIKSERRNRARLKINYILAAIRTEMLEESIDLLSETDEIDMYLLNYIDTLIEKEMKRSKGPTVSEDDSDDSFEGVGQVTLTMLRAVRKRLQVELEMKDRKDLKLLSKLLNINDPDVSSLHSFCSVISYDIP
jgi:hypothetical protein